MMNIDSSLTLVRILLCTCSPSYNVTSTGFRVGTSLIDADFTALFDSGTSFTYLVDPLYTMLSQSVSMRNHLITFAGLMI